jgi:hypothetical protein
VRPGWTAAQRAASSCRSGPSAGGSAILIQLFNPVSVTELSHDRSSGKGEERVGGEAGRGILTLFLVSLE